MFPIQVSLKESFFTSSYFTLIPQSTFPSKPLSDLTQSESQQLAMTLETPSQRFDLATTLNQNLGIIPGKQSLPLQLTIQHGRSFAQNQSFQLRLTLIFELLN